MFHGVKEVILQNSPIPVAVGPTDFSSILHPGSREAAPHYNAQQPDCLSDLNLDQVVAALTAGHEAYDLRPFFHTPLHDADRVGYRQNVMRDVRSEPVSAAVRTFAAEMNRMRDTAAFSQKLHYRFQQMRWLADAVDIYCEAVLRLRAELSAAGPVSEGLRAFLGYLQGLTTSASFQARVEQTRHLKKGLAGVRYDLLIGDGTIIVRRRGEEADYTADVEETFRRFRVGNVAPKQFKLPDYAEMNHIEAGVLDRVALVYPDIFGELAAYADRHAAFTDERVMAFDREIQFYLAAADLIAPLDAAGLPFCYPEVSATCKSVSCEETFDLALAVKLLQEQQPVVQNDFRLAGAERIFVVSGPNQGGKTTFARTFGQLHFLGSLGLPVPGSAARLYLPDRIFTHFERAENIHDLRGKLQDDLVRMHDILKAATPRSVIIMNEIFTSTALSDAIILGRKVLEKVIALDALCVCVTLHRRARNAGRDDRQRCQHRHPGRSVLAYLQDRAQARRRARLCDRRRPETPSHLCRHQTEARSMKAFLLHRDRDFDFDAPSCAQEAALIQDLELNTLFAAMAGEDRFLFDVARKVVLSAVPASVAAIRYRQDILSDCLAEPGLVRAIYAVAVEAQEREKKIHHLGLFADSPQSVVGRAVEVLAMLVDLLRRLRGLVDAHAAAFHSEGFTALFSTLQRELDDAYLSRLVDHIEVLRFRRGILMSAELGAGSKGSNYILRRQAPAKSLWSRLFEPRRECYVLQLHPRDEAGARAFSELRDRGLAIAAAAIAEAVEHMLGFLRMLRAELAFYVGCLNLNHTLSGYGALVSLPVPDEADSRDFACAGLYDVCLALGLKRGIVGNDIGGDGRQLILITGANQGGKSTFLRSVGLAQLMMQAGMFVPATALSAEIVSGVFTHYKREEDSTLRSGKFDEELARMSAMVDLIRPDALVLFNESFASTNEREGSQIATDVIRALLDDRVKVFFVTHMFELADSLQQEQDRRFLFLRAERGSSGNRSFRLIEGPPLSTSFGADLYEHIFGEPVEAELQRISAGQKPERPSSASAWSTQS